MDQLLTGHVEEGSVELLTLDGPERVGEAVLQLPRVVAANLDIGLAVTTALHVVRADLPLVPENHEQQGMHMAIRVRS